MSDLSRIRRDLGRVDLASLLSRPPWHVASTAEIAEAANISFGRLSNWVVRKQFVRSEPRVLYRVGNKRLYRMDRVTEWMSGVSLSDQAIGYLADVGLAPPSEAGGGV